MSFLAPLFLLGTLAIAFPILFHLIRRRARRKQTFSSFMFLEESPPTVTQRSKLENLWLLLLRCLILVLLAVAFARPYLARSPSTPPELNDVEHHVLLLDISASMRPPQLWNEASSRLSELVASLPPTDPLALLTFDEAVHPVILFEEWRNTPIANRHALAAGRIQALQPGWSATDIGTALRTALELADDARTAQGGRDQGQLRFTFHLLSDLQEGAARTDLQALVWPSRLHVKLHPVQLAQSHNAYAVYFPDNDLFGPVHTNATARFRVSNSPWSPSSQLQLGWANPLAPAQFISEPRQIHLKPGESRMVSLPLLPSTTNSVAYLKGDQVEFDNRLFIPARSHRQIVLPFFVRQSANDPSVLLYYLLRALPGSESSPIQLLPADPDQPDAFEQWDQATLAMVAAPLPSQIIDQLRRWIAAGNTCWIILDQPETAQLLSPLLGRSEPIPGRHIARADQILQNIQFQHPVFLPFSESRFSDFSKIRFWQYHQLDPRDLPDDTVLLAEFDNGDPALLQIPLQDGHLLVLTSGWQPAASQLALSSKFVPLIYAVLQWSRALETSPSLVQVNQEVSLPQGATVKAVTTQPNAIAQGARSFRPQAPGIYQINTPSTNSSPTYLAANLAPEESRLAPISAAELAQLGLPLSLEPSPPEAGKASGTPRPNLQALAVELENQQQHWRWILAFVAALALIETVSAARLSRAGGTTPAAGQ